jgi:gliding motility-associated protein GldC
MKKAVITLEVNLDDNNVPLDIQWHSTDSKNQEKVPCKSMFISLWDAEHKNTLKIDLWTKEMPVHEMKQFFYETLVTMADTFQKATGEENISEDLRDYCAHFAEKMELINASKS